MVAASGPDHQIAAFFDVDRTLVRGSSLLALAAPLWRAGLLPRSVALQAAIRGLQFSSRGLSEDKVRRAVTAISRVVRGMDAAAMRQVADTATPRILAPRVYDEALRLIEWHHQHGHLVFLVSASTHDLIDKLGEIVGADGVVASEAEIVDGHYTGRVELCHGAAKAEALRRLARGHGIDLERSYAYGDALGDLPMLEAVGHPIAVNPDGRLRVMAEQRRWRQLRFRRRSRWVRLTSLRRAPVAVRKPVPHRRPVPDQAPEDVATIVGNP
jgi:HAD superfamily hydrolase (TIGR01490 family)